MADFNALNAEIDRAAALLAGTAGNLPAPVTVVHHNDADGLAAAAALSYALDRAGLEGRRLAVEKIHEPILPIIHRTEGPVLYADLGGQSAGIIERHALHTPLVIILDHHLPDSQVCRHLVHINPERFGISGDTEASGAAVSALFAGALLARRTAGLSAQDKALPALMGVIGAVGDGQAPGGVFSGINRPLFETARQLGEIAPGGEDGPVIPRFGRRPVSAIVETLNLLGSVGFYSGHAETAVAFLLGQDDGQVPAAAARRLDELKHTRFAAEVGTISRRGMTVSPHFQWVDVANRFAPMGVKAIGLFLEALIHQGLAAQDRYLLGFQHMPDQMPGIGRIPGSLTKVSARVPPQLKAEIDWGRHPDFMTLIPQASALVGGSADGCHRFAAAALIQRGREAAFMQTMEETLAGWRRDRPQIG